MTEELSEDTLKVMGWTKKQSFGMLGGKLFQFVDWIDANGKIMKSDIRTEETSAPDVHNTPALGREQTIPKRVR